MTNLPSQKQITEFITHFQDKGEGPPTRSDIAKAFHIKGPDRRELRRLLKHLEDNGIITLEGKRASLTGTLPAVAVIDAIEATEDGDLLCEPVLRDFDGPMPQVLLPHHLARKTKPPVGVGTRFLGKLKPVDGEYEAEPIKVIGKGAERLLGVYFTNKKGGRVEPVGRKNGHAYVIDAGDTGDAKPGDLVWIELKNQRGYGPRHARIREVVGDVGQSKNWSLIALAEQDIAIEFPDNVVEEANAQKLPDLKYHEDKRELPLVTIDPATAKDHDDAVYAERLNDGWRVTVAIADVSWFVRPGSALDKEAEKRGNSVYLVDRVVPMLPEVLSNGLCSLKAGEDRPALCCEMELGEDGRKRKHRFYRAMIKSKAGLSYEEAEAAHLGNTNDRTAPIKDSIIDPLYGAYEAMLKARAQRSPLELELPERQIVLNDDGQVAEITMKDRFDAHKLIEIMMVAANVCAAESLEHAKRTLIYRVHDEPDPERVEGLRTYLESLDYSLPKGQTMKPQNFNRILEKARERDQEEIVSMAILRTQSQAIYDTENVGHFGLHLSRYAHFTSPIRRYADLTVHRGLVAAFKLGPGGMTQEDEARLPRVAERISDTERKAVSAERATQDRFLAAYLEKEVGADFHARISGVTRAGLFVQLEETGADGFVPMRTLTGDYYWYDEEHSKLVGRHTGGTYVLGQKVEVRLLEVTPVQGGMRFEMLSEPLEPEAHQRRGPSRSKKKTSGKSSRPPGKKPSGKKPSGKKRAAPPTEKHAPKKANGKKRAADNAAPDEKSGAALRRRPRKSR